MKMSYEEQKIETENLSADEQKIREMCISLKKIAAPRDFDFKLKARIANSKASDFQPRFGFAFRYAVPALAMIFVLGFLAFNSGMFSSPKNNSALAGSAPETKNPSLPQNTLVSATSDHQEQEQPNENSRVLPVIQKNTKITEGQQVAKVDPQKSKRIFDKVKKDSFKGSKDSALTGEKPKQPNINSNNAPQSPIIIEKSIPHPVKELLAQFGINAVFENGKWVVRSVVQNGVAESSGVKESDIVEALDDQIISNDPISAKTLNFKNITVTRNGGKLEIKLRNKQ